jgi:voltage-gated potassium channel
MGLGMSRQVLMEILDGSNKHRASRYVEWMITFAVLSSCLSVVLDSVPSIHAVYKEEFHWFEVGSVLFFTIEYVLRIWAYGARYPRAEGGPWRGRKEYAFSFFGLVDFFATAPFYMQIFMPHMDLRVLRVLRLLRVLKLSKYNSALQDLFHAVHSERRAFASAAFLLVIVNIVSASLMYFAEGHDQPQHFGSIPMCMYWAIVTITSGYGNVEPVTAAGESIALLTGFIGVCMAAIMTGIVASAFSNQMSRKRAAYEAQLREVLADGVVSEAEKATLKRLQRQFGLSDEEVEKLMHQANAENQSAGGQQS